MKKIVISILLVITLTPVFSQRVEDENTHERRYRALGIANYAMAYMTYISIGVLGDAYANRTYKPNQLVVYAGKIISILRLTITAGEKLIRNGDIEHENLKLAKGILKAYKLMRTQTRFLIKFARTGNRQNAVKFDEYRKKAWNIISKLEGK